jgi:hypothetical protein
MTDLSRHLFRNVRNGDSSPLLEYLQRGRTDWSPHPERAEVLREYDRVWSLVGSQANRGTRSRAYGAEWRAPEHRSREAQRAACRSAVGRRRRQPLKAASAESEEL